MGQTRRIFIIILVTVGLIGGGGSRLFAQGVNIILDVGGFALIYVKPFGTYTSVELSTDLLSWTAIYPLDEIQSESDGYQTIRSGLGTAAAEQMFFRLLVSPAWTVTLAWDYVPDPEIAGYRLYYREGSEFTYADIIERQIDVGNATTASVYLPVNRSTYHLAVTSYTTAGVESDRSEEVIVTRPAMPF